MSANVGTPAARPEEPFTSGRLTRSLQVAFGASIVAIVYGFASLNPALRAPPTGTVTMCDWDGDALRHVLVWIHPHGWTVGVVGSLAMLLLSLLLRVSRHAAHGGHACDEHDDIEGRAHESSAV